MKARRSRVARRALPERSYEDAPPGGCELKQPPDVYSSGCAIGLESVSKTFRPARARPKLFGLVTRRSIRETCVVELMMVGDSFCDWQNEDLDHGRMAASIRIDDDRRGDCKIDSSFSVENQPASRVSRAQM